MRVSPSVLAADLIDLRRSLQSMDPSIVDLIHLDVMDGHYVPQLSFGEAYARAVKSATSIPLDVHLMVAAPERECPKYFDLHPAYLTFHAEATHFGVRLAQSIREQGIGAGVSLNPGTPVERLAPLLDHVDLALVMSVEPGFYGQKFLPQSVERVRQLREMIGRRPVAIQVDGGINTANIAALAQNGASIVVAGAFCFQGDSINSRVQALKEAAAASPGS
ncbi:MAG: ribulose-phosphate 3-epimerase [Leptospirales bacterium]|nr:ribulose-phosphate 3-epimerase [Leptospirales bacterium]